MHKPVLEQTLNDTAEMTVLQHKFRRALKRLRRDGLEFEPPPPSATGTRAAALTVHSFHYRGARLRQRVDEATVTFELLDADAAAAPLGVSCAGSAPTQLVRGAPATYARGAGKCTLAPLGGVGSGVARAGFGAPQARRGAGCGSWASPSAWGSSTSSCAWEWESSWE